MAPYIRRYLRISKFTVLECRIYVSDVDPGLTNSWLLAPRHPILPRVIETVRPLILQRLRDDAQKAKDKGKRGKATKKIERDTIVGEGFEVSVHLVDDSSPHSILIKRKLFSDPAAASSVPEGVRGTAERPIEVGDAAVPQGILLEEPDDDTMMNLDDIPAASEQGNVGSITNTRGTSRLRGDEPGTINEIDDVDSDVEAQRAHPRKGQKSQTTQSGREAAASTAEEDKKKLMLETAYDGLNIRIKAKTVCLIVKRTAKGLPTEDPGNAVMENWIRSTQKVAENDE